MSLRPVELWLQILRSIRDVRVLLVPFQPQQIRLRVHHPVQQHRRDLAQERSQVILQLLRLCEPEPELACLQRNGLVLVLGRVDHELGDVGELGDDLVGSGGEEEGEGLTDCFSNVGRFVRGSSEQGGEEGVDVGREGRRVGDDERVEARDGLGAVLRVWVVGGGDEFGDEEVEESLTVDLDVELFGEILADLEEGREGSLEKTRERRRKGG